MKKQADEPPLVSVILVCYQQEAWVEEAITSLFLQDYRPLEVVICDDCSTDRTVARIVSALENAPDDISVKFMQSPVNRGLAGNINAGFDLSSGDFIFTAAGDDVSLPQRVSRCMESWRTAGFGPDLVCTQFADIDENSVATGRIGGSFFFPDPARPVAKWRCGATGACAAYSREVFLKFGPIDPDVHAEDWVLSFRAWLLGGGLLISEPLVQHRTHSSSISVQVRSLEQLPTRQERRVARQKIAIGIAGIAREWARAWKIMERDEATGRRLAQQAEVAGMIADSFQPSRWQALGAIAKLLGAGRPKDAARNFVRNICGFH